MTISNCFRISLLFSHYFSTLFRIRTNKCTQNFSRKNSKHFLSLSCFPEKTFNLVRDCGCSLLPIKQLRNPPLTSHTHLAGSDWGVVLCLCFLVLFSFSKLPFALLDNYRTWVTTTKGYNSI